MNSKGELIRDRTLFLLVDLQEKLVPVIANKEQIISNTSILTRAADLMGLPLFVTEQYPQGLGETVTDIHLPAERLEVEKVSFSCFDHREFVDELVAMDRETIVLFGIEAHICILKTALAGLSRDYQIHVIADAVGSRSEENRRLALERMRQSGVFIASTEMILFQLLETSGTEEFKRISELIR